MPVFSSAPHHDVLILLIQISLLLLAARFFGEVAQRFKQPAVLGEILSGIILGPSLLSGFFPAVGQFVIPQTPLQGHLLEVISMIGAIMLMLITGLETDLVLIKRHARTALGVSFGGIICTFGTGYILGQQIPDSLLVDPNQRLVFSLFIATAMSISAIPIIAKVLMDMNLMRRDIGQITLAAGMNDDTVGWILLSIVVGLATGEGVSAGSIFFNIGKIVFFLLLSFTIGRFLVRKILDFVQDEAVSHERLLSLVIVLTFAWAALTQALHLEAVLGAFVMGIMLTLMPRLPQAVIHRIESLTLGIFSPIFFAVAGLKVNILHLLTPQLIILTIVAILVATLGKFLGTYIGAVTIGKQKHWQALSFGAGLNARGAMQIIFAMIGLSLGIISQDIFSVIVVVGITTSLLAPVALRWTIKHIEPEGEEAARLKTEELESKSLIGNIHRVLLPVTIRENLENTLQIVESKILSNLGAHTELSITLFCITQEDKRQEAEKFLSSIETFFPAKEVLKKTSVAEDIRGAILDEASKDYDLLVLGASGDKVNKDSIFDPIVDSLIRMSPCSTFIIKSGAIEDNWSPKRILVPTDGSVTSKHSADLGFILSKERNQVTLLHVISQAGYFYQPTFESERIQKRLQIGQQFMDQLKELGEARGALVNTVIEVGRTPEQVILDIINKQKIDLLVLGTDIRVGSDRLFLGPKVENLIEHATCPVVVVNPALNSES